MSGAATFSTSGSVGQGPRDRPPLIGAAPVRYATARPSEPAPPMPGALIFHEVDPGTGYWVATTDDPVRLQGGSGREPGRRCPSGPSTTANTWSRASPTSRPGTARPCRRRCLPGPVEDGPLPDGGRVLGLRPVDRAPTCSGRTRRPPTDRRRRPVRPVPPSLLRLQRTGPTSSMMALAMGCAVVAVNVRALGVPAGPTTSSSRSSSPTATTSSRRSRPSPGSGPPRRHGRALLPGNRPAVRRLDQPAVAGRDRSAVGHRRHRPGHLSPAGSFNVGFAGSWAEDVGKKAEAYGRGLGKSGVDAGDTTCADNQLFRGRTSTSPPRPAPSATTAEDGRPTQRVVVVDKIDVPVFLTGSFQDEQTGGRFLLLFEPLHRIPGHALHRHERCPPTAARRSTSPKWKTFLDLYVAGKLTDIPTPVRLFAPVIMDRIFQGRHRPPLPPRLALDRAGRAAYGQSPDQRPVRVGRRHHPTRGRRFRRSSPHHRVPPGTRPETSTWARRDHEHHRPTAASRAPVPTRRPASRSIRPLAERTTFTGDSGDIFHALPTTTGSRNPTVQPRCSCRRRSTKIRSSRVRPAGPVDPVLDQRRPGGDAVGGPPDGKRPSSRPGAARRAPQRWPRVDQPAAPALLLKSDAEPLEANTWTEARADCSLFAHIVRAGSRIRPRCTPRRRPSPLELRDRRATRRRHDRRRPLRRAPLTPGDAAVARAVDRHAVPAAPPAVPGAADSRVGPSSPTRTPRPTTDERGGRRRGPVAGRPGAGRVAVPTSTCATNWPCVWNGTCRQPPGLSSADHQVLVHLSGDRRGSGPACRAVPHPALAAEPPVAPADPDGRRGLVERLECHEGTVGGRSWPPDPAGRSAIVSAAPGHVRDLRDLLIEPPSSDGFRSWETWLDGCSTPCPKSPPAPPGPARGTGRAERSNRSDSSTFGPNGHGRQYGLRVSPRRAARTRWPVTEAINSKSLSTCRTLRSVSSAVAAISRSGTEGALWCLARTAPAGVRCGLRSSA